MRRAWVFISAAWLVAGEARAQGVAWVSEPSLDPNSTPTVEGTGVPTPGEVTLVNHLAWDLGPVNALGIRERMRDVWSLQVGVLRNVALGVQVPVIPYTDFDFNRGTRGPSLGDTRFTVRWSGLNAGSVLAASPPLSSVRCGGRCGRGWSVGGALGGELTVPGDAPDMSYGEPTFRLVGQLEVRYLRFAIGANVTYLSNFDRSAELLTRDRLTVSLSVRRPFAALLAMFSLFSPALADWATVLSFGIERVLGSPYVTLTASFEASSLRNQPSVVEVGYGVQRQVGSFVFSLGGVNDVVDGGGRVLFSAGWRPPEDEDHDGVADEDDRCIGVRGTAREHGCPTPDDPVVHERETLNGRTHVYEVP
jgi:hypothetical protein